MACLRSGRVRGYFRACAGPLPSSYCLQVPANRWGFAGQGMPFSVVQLRVLQEGISLSVFFVLALYLDEKAEFKWNHAAAGLCLVAAVYFTSEVSRCLRLR